MSTWRISRRTAENVAAGDHGGWMKASHHTFVPSPVHMVENTVLQHCAIHDARKENTLPRSQEKNPSKNISRLRHKGYPQRQAIAIGLAEARRAGGRVAKKKSKKRR
jgi:GR25 family glycosyltransferase involved in LPS biosynthesis